LPQVFSAGQAERRSPGKQFRTHCASGRERLPGYLTIGESLLDEREQDIFQAAAKSTDRPRPAAQPDFWQMSRGNFN